MGFFVTAKAIKHSLDLRLLQRQGNAMMQVLRLDPTEWSASLYLRDDRDVARLNRRYRGKRRPTDILSFPWIEGMETPGALPSDLDPEEKYLGDIFINVPYVERHCLREGKKLELWVPRLLAHGLCHLLRYDHETEEDYRIMRQKEDEILRDFSRYMES